MVNQSLFCLIAQIDGEFEREWTVAALAKRSKMSISHFRRLFKEAIGISPNEYLHNRRLLKAHEMLSDPLNFDSIKSIRYKVGLVSNSHFSHDFKKQFGKTPSEFRRLMQSNYQAERKKGKI